MQSLTIMRISVMGVRRGLLALRVGTTPTSLVLGVVHVLIV